MRVTPYAVPEGDTLHRAANHLRPLLVGQAVRGFELVRRAEPTEGLIGKQITAVEARGKNLLVSFEGGLALHVHLKMNGRIHAYPDAERRRPGRETVVVLDTDRHRVLVESAPVARLIHTR